MQNKSEQILYVQVVFLWQKHAAVYRARKYPDRLSLFLAAGDTPFILLHAVSIQLVNPSIYTWQKPNISKRNFSQDLQDLVGSNSNSFRIVSQ